MGVGAVASVGLACSKGETVINAFQRCIKTCVQQVLRKEERQRTHDAQVLAMCWQPFTWDFVSLCHHADRETEAQRGKATHIEVQGWDSRTCRSGSASNDTSVVSNSSLQALVQTFPVSSSLQTHTTFPCSVSLIHLQRDTTPECREPRLAPAAAGPLHCP